MNRREFEFVLVMIVKTEEFSDGQPPTGDVPAHACLLRETCAYPQH
jgi:hypothetical protein